jgi:hypothetical protein
MNVNFKNELLFFMTENAKSVEVFPSLVTRRTQFIIGQHTCDGLSAMHWTSGESSASSWSWPIDQSSDTIRCSHRYREMTVIISNNIFSCCMCIYRYVAFLFTCKKQTAACSASRQLKCNSQISNRTWSKTLSWYISLVT